MIKNSKLEKILDEVQTPVYICEEALLRANLQRLDYVQKQSGAKVLLALKGFAFKALFDMVGEYLHGCTCSGLHEAKLAYEYMNKEIHTYSPAFKECDIEEILSLSNHIVFNSFEQWKKYKEMALKSGVSCGLRTNPEVSSSPVDLYNPCGVNSRLGITKANFEPDMLDGVEGLHFHALCEQNVDALEAVLAGFEKNFGEYLHRMKWVNFGGGHHI